MRAGQCRKLKNRHKSSMISTETTMGAVIGGHVRRAPDRIAIVGDPYPARSSYCSLAHQISKLRDEFRNGQSARTPGVGLIFQAARRPRSQRSRPPAMPLAFPSILVSPATNLFANSSASTSMPWYPEWLEFPALKAIQDYPSALFAVTKAESAFDRIRRPQCPRDRIAHCVLHRPCKPL